jgi:hypothetical protein
MLSVNKPSPEVVREVTALAAVDGSLLMVYQGADRGQPPIHDHAH